ncbi:MAG: 50S ribosomal protein L10 [candidate division Zixibacteria bacterium]|nr:50S ribosomal protein L10 [candidate division Zixibacteria bacterium]
MSRAKKEAVLADLRAAFAEAGGALFTDFRGVDVAGMTRLRARLRREGARYVVAKRTLAELALAEAPSRDELLEGATGIAFLGEEAVAVAKVLVDFKKEYESFVIKGGLLGGEFFPPEKIGELANTPPRDVLLGMLLATVKSPHTSFVGVLSGIIRKAVATLAAITEKETEGETATRA